MNPVVGKSKTYRHSTMFSAPSLSVENFDPSCYRAVNSLAAFAPCGDGSLLRRGPQNDNAPL
jgi:hypothetical protein